MSTIEHLELRLLGPAVKLGVEGQGWGQDGMCTYEFIVTQPGETPVCILTKKDASGRVVAQGMVIIEGTGFWTTPDENPAQSGSWPFVARQERALSIHRGQLINGGELVIRAFEDPKKRASLTKDLKIKGLD